MPHHLASSGLNASRLSALGIKPLIQAYPNVVTSTSGSDPSSPVTITLPTGYEADDILLAFLYTYTTSALPGVPAGWTSLLTRGNSFAALQVAYRVADGTEAATVDFTSSGSVSWIAHRIANAGVSEATFIEGASIEDAPNIATINPPPLTPSWGAARNLWVAYACSRRSYFTVSAPTNYSDLLVQVAGADGSDQVSSAETASAQRQLDAATEDPPTFSYAGGLTNQPFGVTIAVRPAAGI